jgi:hypothetical protein
MAKMPYKTGPVGTLFIELCVRSRPRLCENANLRLRLVKTCSNQGA